MIGNIIIIIIVIDLVMYLVISHSRLKNLNISDEDKNCKNCKHSEFSNSLGRPYCNKLNSYMNENQVCDKFLPDKRLYYKVKHNLK